MGNKCRVCPICGRKRVRLNKHYYAFPRYRCDCCKGEWHSYKSYAEAFTTKFSEVEPKLPPESKGFFYRAITRDLKEFS